MRQPDFGNLLAILRKEVPKRPTLFELFLNESLYRKFSDPKVSAMTDAIAPSRRMLHGMKGAGYDYASIIASEFAFPSGEAAHLQTRSINEGGVISDRKTFDDYDWMDPDKCDYSRLDVLARDLPERMKFMVMCPGGVLENAISLVGYERLCMLVADDPGLARDIFDAVGSRLLRYFEIAMAHPAAGVLMSNDDWGFKTQTMLSPADMRKYVFPWHERIVEAAHTNGKPAVLHSCGNLGEVMEDIIEDMKFDGKHSYEDAIMPVERVYDKYAGRIAILGGIDVDFLCRRSVEEIRERSRAMLERAARKGSYALGTGNSVPEYIPDEKFFTMTAIALEG